MSTTTEVESPVRKAKKEMTSRRVKNSETKRKVGKLGEKTYAHIPDDIEVMFAGKNYVDLTMRHVGTQNAYKAFLREYSTMSPEIRERLDDQFNMFEASFKLAKKNLTKLAELHPLWDKFKDVRGFSATQLGLIMSLIKTPERFSSPSKLMVYAGVGTWYGINVNKMNMNKIKEEADKRGLKFEGFSTMFSGKMETIVDCLMRSRGFFYDYYNRKKAWKMEKTRNEGRVFVATKDDVKLSKVVDKDSTEAEPDPITGEPKVSKMEVGKEYIIGRKNQSLISYADRSAKNTIKNILLHLIYTEWMKLRGFEPRNPYAIDYLGHKTMITLEDIAAFDIATKARLGAAEAE